VVFGGAHDLFVTSNAHPQQPTTTTTNSTTTIDDHLKNDDRKSVAWTDALLSLLLAVVSSPLLGEDRGQMFLDSKLPEFVAVKLPNVIFEKARTSFLFSLALFLSPRKPNKTHSHTRR
jgi:hypothetical protein